MHVTRRLRGELPNLRGPKPMGAFRGRLRKGRNRFGFLLAHCSVQRNHVNMLGEADHVGDQSVDLDMAGRPPADFPP